MDNKEIQVISGQTIKRYTDRYNIYRHEIKTLGWGSQEMQEYRFSQLAKYVNMHDKSLLDIGCGFGDLFNYLEKHDVLLNKYIGWDINYNLIADTRVFSPKASLKVFDIALEKPAKPVANIGCMFGLLNWNLNDREKNYDYSMRLISNAFEAVTDVLVVDFLSSYITADYPKEDIVFYHDPSVMLSKLYSLTSNVDMIHSYLPIPQKEFMLILYK